jgi:hypothetical protein
MITDLTAVKSESTDGRYAITFRDMESQIHDLICMTRIMADKVYSVLERSKDDEVDAAIFTIFHVRKMAEQFESAYQEAFEEARR